MFTSGKSSKGAHDRYFNEILKTNLKQCSRVGTYQKLWGNGNPMNMGKYEMPKENIYIFTRSGELEGLQNWELDFRMVPPLKSYPTAKPLGMIRKLVEQATKIGEWILEPFGGSGVTLKACMETKRKCHIFDISEKAIYDYILPIVQN